MNFFILRGAKAALSSAFFLSLGLTGLGPASAAPPPHTFTYHCVAEVSTGLQPPIAGQSGAATLSIFVVSGATLHAAVDQCHQGARNAFLANTAWSDPAQFCARYSQANYEITLGNSGRTRVVWVTDYFQEMGHANGYNRVGGYTVVCNGPAALVQLPPSATPVSSLL
jgi:hypothetical protein